ncbi:hypothetical protein HAX54_048160 [Datura stramonium]|uniref:Uncharacterized protein n=1 Tax=Datura stramonium TaxID=4076 RepID=A0ABS8STY2_DATST|nr:hypothetical protein [Datura stramonium]
MEPLSLKPREKEELFRDGEGMDRDFEGDGGSSKEDLEINLDNQIREEAEKEVKVLDEENDASEESSDTLIRPYKKKKHTPVSGGKASSTKAVGIDFQRKYLGTSSAGYPIKASLRNDLNSQKLLVALNMDSFFSSSSLSTVQLVDDVQNLDYPSNFEPVDSCSIYEFAPGNTTFILGYDATSGDYKIFKPDRGSDDIDLPPSYEILALKSGSWRKIRNYPTRVCPRTGYTLEICPKFDEDNNTEPLAFHHGAFHWLGFRIVILVGMLCVYSTHYNLQMEGNFKLTDRMVVLYLGHPEDHLDYGLKLISIKTGSFIQKA